MTIFLTILFTIIIFNFLIRSTDLEDFLEARINYTLATVAMSAILFLLHRL